MTRANFLIWDRRDIPISRKWLSVRTHVQCMAINISFFVCMVKLTHCGRMTHICVGKLTIIGSDNSLSPERRQAIIWTNVGILLVGPLGTNSNEILIAIQTFSFKKMHLKISSAKWRPFCFGLDVLKCLALLQSRWRQSAGKLLTSNIDQSHQVQPNM